jgi:hypothetical protein
MFANLIVRFLLGGAIVSAFAAIAEVFKPKTFAGLFSASPAVALCTLALTVGQKGLSYAAIEGRSMTFAAGALFIYCCVCIAIAKQRRISVGIGAAIAWVIWGIAALGMFVVGWRAGILS